MQTLKKHEEFLLSCMLQAIKVALYGLPVSHNHHSMHHQQLPHVLISTKLLTKKHKALPNSTLKLCKEPNYRRSQYLVSEHKQH